MGIVENGNRKRIPEECPRELGLCTDANGYVKFLNKERQWATNTLLWHED